MANSKVKKEFTGVAHQSKEIEMSDSTKIKLTIMELSNKFYLDIRLYTLSETGTWLPTKKGVWISLNTVDFKVEEVFELGKELIQEFRNGR
ncbi:MAG TPA: PC4/YdbC family ssDNA-binding protein [Candidatus Nanoarchaeia archaeon]|nr:PC4/YdbC family ssDNA-binding protein [Candidatus Nanoarchaeia archaeon]